MKVEHFDTDSIHDDITKGKNGSITGNIALTMNNERVMTMISDYIQDNES